MLYLISTQQNRYGSYIYSLFETHTESVFKVSDKIIAKLLNVHGMAGKNVCVTEQGISVKNWPHSIRTYSNGHDNIKSPYILLSKISEQRFKLVNRMDLVVYIDESQLKELIASEMIANCSFSLNKQQEKSYMSTDTYETTTDSSFVSSIDKKYCEFKAKAALLGLGLDFEYSIENEDVKIRKYVGKSKRVILPTFITTICDNAFSYVGIKEVILNNGLQHIGNNAFHGNSIKQVVLPNSVEFVGQSAFDGDAKGRTIYTKLNTNTLIIN